jgi:hypothetical protein
MSLAAQTSAHVAADDTRRSRALAAVLAFFLCHALGAGVLVAVGTPTQSSGMAIWGQGN